MTEELTAPPATNRKRPGRTLLLRATTFSVLIVLLTIIGFSGSLLYVFRKDRLQAMRTQTRNLASIVENSCRMKLSLGEYEKLVDQLQVYLLHNPGIIYIAVAGRDGTTILCGRDSWILASPEDIKATGSELPAGNAAVINKSSKFGKHFAGNYVLYHETIPLGNIRVGMSLDEFKSANKRLLQIILALGAGALVIGVGLSVAFSRRLSHPLTQITEFAHDIAAGKFDRRLELSDRGELNYLAETMNWMSANLEDSRKNLKTSLQSDAQLREKTILLREIHHRVKNNMQILISLLRLQERKVESEELLSVLHESQGRIQTMALLHEKLYQSESISEVSMPCYIHTLTDHLVKVCGSDPRVTVDLDVDNLSLEIDTALPCGLIINELVTNSIKYAFGKTGSTISITMKEEAEQVRLTVSDDGEGMPEGFDAATANTLGLRLVRLLCCELQAPFTMSNNSGTQFCMTFKPIVYKERI